jgi:hypothetical protein
MSFAATLCVIGVMFSISCFSKEQIRLEEQLISLRHPYTSRSRINIH